MPYANREKQAAARFKKYKVLKNNLFVHKIIFARAQKIKNNY